MPTYKVNQRRIAISRSYDVATESGERVFRIAGKPRFARTFDVVSAAGERLLAVRETLLAVDPTWAVSRGGALAATVKRRTTSGATTDRFTIEVPSGPSMEAAGKLHADHGVTVSAGGSTLARIRRELGPVTREEFALEVFVEDDPPLLVALAMAIVECDPSRGAP